MIYSDIPINNHETITLGELFCGAGGMALGAEMAGTSKHQFKTIWAIDNNTDACATFQHNIDIQPDKVICRDIKNLDFNSLATIDGLMFGFPCNDFSVIGKRQGIKGHYGRMYSFGVKGLKTFQPKFFVAENVSGLTSTNSKSDFYQIITEFETQGYVISHQLYKFEEYGIPQRRHRIIIVGFRKDLNIYFNHPSPTTQKPKTAAQALQNIPSQVCNHELTKQHPRVVERLSYIKPGQNIFTADLPKHLQYKMHSNAEISQIYRKLVPDQPSYTITGSGGGGTYGYHWNENRALTNRERARLQTFPDNFVFKGSKTSIRRQIGMAVPPQGSKIIFSAVLRTLIENDII